MTRSPVICVLLSPWPLQLLARRHPGLPLAVLGEHGRRVLYVKVCRPHMARNAAFRCLLRWQPS